MPIVDLLGNAVESLPPGLRRVTRLLSSEQGELQGALACIGSLTSIVAPPLLTNLFAYFSSGRAPVYFPGAAFLAASLCLVAAAAVFSRMRATQPVLQAAE